MPYFKKLLGLVFSALTLFAFLSTEEARDVATVDVSDSDSLPDDEEPDESSSPVDEDEEPDEEEPDSDSEPDSESDDESESPDEDEPESDEEPSLSDDDDDEESRLFFVLVSLSFFFSTNAGATGSTRPALAVAVAKTRGGVVVGVLLLTSLASVLTSASNFSLDVSAFFTLVGDLERLRSDRCRSDDERRRL